jgi:ribosomal protein S18 acetylase RimI-like enzyme
MANDPGNLNPVLRTARREDLPDLARFIQGYYRFEGIPFDLYRVERGLVPLLGREDLGRVWLIDANDRPVGYLILCFGYSIEKGGRDAMVDEFYIDADYRGRGIGQRALDQAIAEARTLGIVSVFLEVDRTNAAAQQLYAGAGFSARDKYLLMAMDCS